MCWLVLNLVIEILRHSSINRRDRKSREGHGNMDHQIRTQQINIISKSNTGNGLAFIWSFSHAFYCCPEKQENMQINKFAIILNVGPCSNKGYPLYHASRFNFRYPSNAARHPLFYAPHQRDILLSIPMSSYPHYPQQYNNPQIKDEGGC